MSQYQVTLTLPASNLVFDESKNPVQTASNGVPYVDVPAVGFYAGTHKGLSYSPDHVRQLETSFKTPTEELYGTIPLMIDHSTSNRDKIGHLRSVQTVGDSSLVVARVIGAEAIQGLREGKYRTMSAGLSLFSDDSDDTAKYSYTGECEDCGEHVSASDDGICPNCGHDCNDDDSMSNFSRLVQFAGRKFTVSYDHHCFTPFPALPDCKTYSTKRRSTTMSDNAKAVPVKTLHEKQLEELHIKFSALEASNVAVHSQLAAAEAARAVAETDSKSAKEEARQAARKYEANQLAETYLKAGKITPASREFSVAFMSILEPEVLELHKKFMELQPAVIILDVIGNPDTRKPQEQNPIQGSGQDVNSAAAELLKFARKHKA